MSAASGRLILVVDHYAVLFTKKSFPEDVNRGRNWWAQLPGYLAWILLIWVGIGSKAGRRKPSLRGKRRNISLSIFVVYVLECEGPNSSETFTLYPLWDKIKADECSSEL